MARKKTKKEKNEGLFYKISTFLKEKSLEAQKASILLVVLLLLGITTGILGSYLYTPAKEIYVAESTFQKESRSIYDFPANSKERANQIAKAEEAENVFASVMDKHLADTNTLIQGYAKLHSGFVKTIIAIAIVLPYISIAIMFIGGPINFLFAVANIVLVAPVKAIVYLFNSCRENKKLKKDKKPSIKMELKEA